MIVVLVLMTNCQVSLKLKSGPVSPQVTIISSATKKVEGRPARNAAAFARRLNQERFSFIGQQHNGSGPWSLRMIRSNLICNQN